MMGTDALTVSAGKGAMTKAELIEALAGADDDTDVFLVPVDARFAYDVDAVILNEAGAVILFHTMATTEEIVRALS